MTRTINYTCALYRDGRLNRLTDYDRGDLNGTFSGISTLSFAQEWSLKALGNWTSFREDGNGNGTFSDAADLTQTRSHNKANEITGITGEQPGQVAWATPAYDAMGNVTSYPKPSAMNNSYTCKYDAWNRLVEVKDGANLVGAYSYDGLGRRIIKKTYDSDGSLVETRQFYYSNEWQVLEERVDGRSNPQERQYVWGIGYVDELILRDRDTADDGNLNQRHYGLQDANYSLTCIIDTAGDAAERYVYTPYGTRDIRSADFSSSLSSSAVGWNIGHQGLMHDTNTSLIYNRMRMLHPGLGRFMQRDPWKYADGMNLYQYVRSGPVRGLDPLGRQALVDPARQIIDALGRAAGLAQLAAGLNACNKCLKDAEDETKKDLGDLKLEGYRPESNEWKLLHCLNSCNAQQMCFNGIPSGATMNFVGGLLYELQTALGFKLNVGQHAGAGGIYTYIGTWDTQNPAMWMVDTPGDVLANSLGIVAGVLGLDCKATCIGAHAIPGPDMTGVDPNITPWPIVPIRPGNLPPL
ncbi:RHS repeat domain-containing protein [Fontivita pretiosa]|uniref:RHS repeat domain-containing protein n=1 Tax=Fontivita pretiosa TaxID=2989684 RepID=UPI003D17CD78